MLFAGGATETACRPFPVPCFRTGVLRGVCTKQDLIDVCQVSPGKCCFDTAFRRTVDIRTLRSETLSRQSRACANVLNLTVSLHLGSFCLFLTTCHSSRAAAGTVSKPPALQRISLNPKNAAAYCSTVLFAPSSNARVVSFLPRISR